MALDTSADRLSVEHWVGGAIGAASYGMDATMDYIEGRIADES